MQVTRWFERRFPFPIHLESLPTIEARLRGTPARLEDLLRGCPEAILTRKPEGKWSAQEHAGHLLDLEALWLARVNDYGETKDALTPADLTNRATNEANHNARPLGDILSQFRESRGRLLKSIDELDEAAYNRSLPHPRLQTPMRVVDHLFFVAEHDDHHLAYIWELLHEATE